MSVKTFFSLFGRGGSDSRHCPSPLFSKMCFLIAVLGVLSMAAMAFSRDIWLDEAFSLNLIKHSYAEIIALTATDVHPPLYYIILKCLVDVVHALLPSVSVIFIARLVSVVPYVILLSVIACKMRRDFGLHVASLAALCIVAMVHQLEYGVEIRMYSWAMCFVTLAFLQIRDIMNVRSWHSWVLFVAFSLCAAYTHTYALVAAGLLWLALLIWMCVSERGQIWKYVVAAVVTIVGFLPWLIVLIKQLQAVSNSFWMTGFMYGAHDCLLLLLVIVLLLFYVLFREKRIDKDDIFAYIGVALPFGIFVVGMTLSVIMRPVFISRYVIPGLGCLWIGLSYLLGKTGTRAVKTVVWMMIALFCVAHIAYFARKEKAYLVAADKTMTFLGAHKDATFLSNGSHETCTIAMLSGGECLNWGEGPSNEITCELTQKVYDGKVGVISDADEISKRIDNGATVFAFIKGEKEDAAVIDEILRGSGLGYTLVDRLRISNSDAKVYRISKTTDK